MPKSTNYTRVIKIIKKLKDSIKDKDSVKLEKWNRSAHQELDAETLTSLFLEEFMYHLAQSDYESISLFQAHLTKERLEPKINDLIRLAVVHHQSECYQLLKKTMGEDFYDSRFFKTHNALACFYVNGFRHDFEKVLSLSLVSDKLNYAQGLHLKDIENKEMTDLLFKSLPLESKRACYSLNLAHSIENNNVANIKYFFTAMVQEFDLSLDECEFFIKKGQMKESLFLSGVSPVLDMVSGFMEETLTTVKVSPGGLYFQELLGKWELNRSLDNELPHKIPEPIKKNKI